MDETEDSGALTLQEPPGTLGAVLYAAPRAVIPEDDWVRLVRAVAAGEQLALHRLYERAHRPVYTLLLRMTGDRETTEELTLDVFHDLWRRAARYDPADGTVLGWIMNQARSRGIDRLRHDGRRKRVAPPGLEAPAPATSPGGLEAVERSQLGQALRGALDRLGADEREAIEIAYFQELSYADVALRLNQPLGTIKSRIRSGLAKLRHALAAGAQEP